MSKSEKFYHLDIKNGFNMKVEPYFCPLLWITSSITDPAFFILGLPFP